MDLDFEKISKSYDEVHGQTIAQLHSFSQQNYYWRCKGTSVLDIGNGGQTPEEVLGEEVAGTLASFVGVDNSIDMLKRRRYDYQRIVCDGKKLPFQDDSFDYVVINGVFHHLGYLNTDDQIERVSHLLVESRRVCRQETLIYELFVSGWIEQAERVVAALTGFMPAFVLSYNTFNTIATKNGLVCKELRVKTLADLMGNFYWYPVMMTYEWLKVPACFSPFKHTFLAIPSEKHS